MKLENVLIEKYASLFVLLIIAFSVVLRLYHVDQKKGYHVDEFLSFQVVNLIYKDKGQDENFKEKWVVGSDYIDYHFNIKKDRLKSDLKTLLRNTNDANHPNLYYVALRLALFKGIEGVDGAFKYYGAGLNIFFYAVGAFFLYLLFLNVSESKSYALLALFLYSLSLGAISNSLFIRMYELLSTFVILTTFAAFRLLDKKPCLHDYFFLFISFTLGYLTHYYYTVFIVFLTAAVFFHHLLQKRIRCLVYYGAALITGFVAAAAIYPRLVRGFTAYRADGVYSKFDIGYLIGQLLKKVAITHELITHNAIYFLLPITLSIILLAGYHLFKKKRMPLNSKEVYLFLVSCSYSVFVVYISPFENLRYLFGALGLLLIIPVIFVKLVPLNGLKYLMATALCVLYIACNFNPACIKKAHLGRFAYPAAEENTDNLSFRNHPAVPVYLVSSVRWKRGQLIAYFNENQRYKLITDQDAIPDFNETGSKELYVIIEDDNRNDIVLEHIEHSDWLIQNNVHYRYYHILHLKKRA